jgi:hypothetical protein
MAILAVMIPKLLASVAVLAAVHVPSPTCTLHRSGGEWVGPCGTLIEDERTSLSIAPAAAITSGVWRRGETPSAVWAGTVIVGQEAATPVEIEVYGDGTGAIRTQFGWFPVSHFVAATDSLHLDIDSSREVAPSSVDREIVERAAQILSSDRVWNRADDRHCPGDATKWSIYCAMEKATVEVTGAFHHRRPALQVVRAIVDQRTTGRPYDHRLMDYNNDPTTHLGDVQSLFAEAIERIDANLVRGGA